jgi:hypothetical protein
VCYEFQRNLPQFPGSFSLVQVCAAASKNSNQHILHSVRNQSNIIVDNKVMRMFVDIFGCCNAANIFQYPPMRLQMISAVHREKLPIMGKFHNMGRYIISYQEVLRSVLTNVNH